MGKEALLVASFGTSVAQARAVTIDAAVDCLAREFASRALYTAWTSPTIVNKVRALRGEAHDTLEQALERMAADGVDDVLVATTCLLRGGETAKIEAAVDAWAAGGRAAHVAAPLLDSPYDGTVLARAVCAEFDEQVGGDALLLMGHGAGGEANRVYSHVQDGLSACGRPRYRVALLDGEPSFEQALHALLAEGARDVWLAPLMFVAGGHVLKDMAGAGENTWQARLEAHGMRVHPVLRGLGEFPDVRALICAHAHAALAGARA